MEKLQNFVLKSFLFNFVNGLIRLLIFGLSDEKKIHTTKDSDLILQSKTQPRVSPHYNSKLFVFVFVTGIIDHTSVQM